MQLSSEQLIQFQDDGFLCIEGVVGLSARDSIAAEYAALVDQLAARFGLVEQDWERWSFDQRYAALIQRFPAAYEHLDISLPMSAGLPADAGFHAGPAVFSLLTDPHLLALAASVVGPEVYSNPVQHVRMKPPEKLLNAEGKGNSNIARTYWHQDAAVVLESAAETPMLTVWVAMTDANVENGCMEAIRGSHRWDDLALHCPGKTGLGEIFIPENLARGHERVPLQVRAGGVVLLHKKTWHGAGPNTSDHMRWSFDLRYQPAGFSTGRDFFPGFLAASERTPGAVLENAQAWQESWLEARREIAAGSVQAVFNTRWQQYKEHPLCA